MRDDYFDAADAGVSRIEVDRLILDCVDWCGGWTVVFSAVAATGFDRDFAAGGIVYGNAGLRFVQHLFPVDIVALCRAVRDFHEAFGHSRS